MADAVIGAQWGDEGKGKVVDLLCPSYETVVRFQGGNNAGHTVKVKEDVYKLHLIPSGIVHGKMCVLGNGMVIDPQSLLEEMKGLKKEKILISDRAHIVLFTHKLLDWAAEQGKGIGTTQKGIGPAYTSKTRRTTAVRMHNLLNEKRLREILERELPRALHEVTGMVSPEAFRKKMEEFPGFLTGDEFDIDAIVTQYLDFGQQLKQHITDTAHYLKGKENILFEGAQGTLLDVDHGTFPFVTSSSITRGGIASGSGYPHTVRILGIVKAYTTRVGDGPFPSELEDETGEQLRSIGKEFGTTTGRPRRCGWLDLHALKYAHLLNHFEGFALTKLDVLSGLKTLKLCTGYTVQGLPVDFPADADDLAACRPVYEELPGWEEDITRARTFEELPETCQAYVKRIEEFMGVPVVIIGVGPGREETIQRQEW